MTMTTYEEDKYTPEEESFDPEGIAERRRQDEEERLRRRIRREIIRVDSGEIEQELEEERKRMAEEEAERKAEEERQRRRRGLFIVQLFTGEFLDNDNAKGYLYGFTFVAAMCFICIFITFMSLNADREYRQLEKRLTVLGERAIILEEQRYDISTRENVDKLLERHNIQLKDLDDSSMIIRSNK